MGARFQSLLADLTVKMLMPVMVYKWVVEKGFGAGYVFPGRGLVFSKALSTALAVALELCVGAMVATHDIPVSGCPVVSQPWYI